MDVRIIHFYPDLMDLYGSRANLLALKRYLEHLDCDVTVEAVLPGGGAEIARGDFFFMGAGTERSARAAMADFSRYGESLKAAALDCAAMLFAGTAMDLLGASVKEADGSSYEGLGLASFAVEHGRKRIVGDVYGHTDLYPEAVVGFLNKCGVVSGVEMPLLTGLDLGFGNEKERGPEGFHWKNVFASQLTGPLLVKNPKLLETVAAAIYARRGRPLPVDRPVDRWAEKAYAVTEEQLRARAQAK
jgi:CobQ-like glutamine amidotransferase family enzyme